MKQAHNKLLLDNQDLQASFSKQQQKIEQLTLELEVAKRTVPGPIELKFEQFHGGQLESSQAQGPQKTHQQEHNQIVAKYQEKLYQKDEKIKQMKIKFIKKADKWRGVIENLVQQVQNKESLIQNLQGNKI